jgi:hypothetical protein
MLASLLSLIDDWTTSPTPPTNAELIVMLNALLAYFNNLPPE